MGLGRFLGFEMLGFRVLGFWGLGFSFFFFFPGFGVWGLGFRVGLRLVLVSSWLSSFLLLSIVGC